jgi:hypothetical protein
MNVLVEKAKNMHQTVGSQLSQQEKTRFNEIRNQLAIIGSEEIIFGRFQHDEHIIAELVSIIELADRFEVDPATLSAKDPRQFYFSLLAMLRHAEPQPQITPLATGGGGCDIEGGLYFEESFNIQQFNKTPDPHVQRTNADLERLRTFQRLAQALLTLALGDVRAAKWNESAGRVDVPDSIQAGVNNMDVPQREMYETAVSFIDQNMPAKAELQARYMAKRAKHINEEYPPK